MGGSDGQTSLNTVECFDPETKEWTNITSMSTARVNAGATFIDGRVHVVGGFNGKQFLNTIECYNAAGNQWSTFAMHILRERNQDSPTAGVMEGNETNTNGKNTPVSSNDVEVGVTC